MNRSVEQALTSLLPRLTTDLPPQLVELASSLLAQSRHKASALKQEEEICRTYACANLACERLKTSLNLPQIEPRPPVPPRIYNKLYAYLSETLAARPQRTRKPAARFEELPSPANKARTPAKRRENPPTTSASKRALPSRQTPTKERALAAFRTPTKSRKSELAHGGRGLEIAAWIHPVIRGLCARLETRGAAPHVLAGVSSVLTLPTPKPEGGDGKKEKIPGLVAAVYILVHTRLVGRETSGKEYVALRRGVLAAFKALRGDEEVCAKVEAAGGGWEGWEDVTGKDVDGWVMQLSARGWVDLDWFGNIESGAGVERPEAQEEIMEDGEDGEGEEEEDGDEEEAVMGLGTMIQDRVDYLSVRKREEYRIWKEGIMERAEEIERTRDGEMDTT